MCNKVLDINQLFTLTILICFDTLLKIIIILKNRYWVINNLLHYPKCINRIQQAIFNEVFLGNFINRYIVVVGKHFCSIYKLYAFVKLYFSQSMLD